jgi:DNA primase
MATQASSTQIQSQGRGGDTVQQIKDRLSIVEVVQPYVKLTRAGKYWRGLSPFSKEKTPSFYVSPDRGSYYCFSTSQGGDHFTFIEKMEGVDFRGALKVLAEKAGVEIQQLRPEDRQRADQRERLYEVMRAAEQFFAAALSDTSAAFAYARERGLTPETIRAWNLGLAPSGWRGLLEKLSADSFTPKELASAGLIKEADEKPGTWYDRFRSRLMFPIRDTAGRTVAFTGRALEKDEQAKYLNSPETDLFHKSDILFGMDRAKDSIRGRGFAILVEGQFDLLLLHQAGFTNTIALSGTALSSTHLSLIKRYADNLMLALDADRAGLAAAAKSALAALQAGMRVKAVRLPQGKDPADVVSEDGGKTFAELVKNSQSIIEFFLSVLSAQETDDFKLMRRVEETVLPLVVAVKSPLERNRYVEIVARAISQTPEAVREALPKAAAATQSSPSSYLSSGRGDVPANGAHGAYSAESAGHLRKIPASGTSSPMSPEQQALQNRRTLIFGAIQAYPNTALAERLKSEYARITGVSPADFAIQAGSSSPESERSAGGDERAAFEAELAFGEDPHEHAGDELLHAFERMILRDALKAATKKLQAAEAAGNSEAISQAAQECQDLSRRIALLA